MESTAAFKLTTQLHMSFSLRQSSHFSLPETCFMQSSRFTSQNIKGAYTQGLRFNIINFYCLIKGHSSVKLTSNRECRW